MRSVIQSKKECYVCKTIYGLHKHHIIYGIANRKKSEKYGLTVWLCSKHHNMSNEGVHFNKKLDLKLKCACQDWWLDQGYTKEQWISEFGKWWLPYEEEKPPKIF